MLQGSQLHEALRKFNEYQVLRSTIDKLKANTAVEATLQVSGAAIKMDKQILICLFEAQITTKEEELNALGINPK